jgi:hypothetical protein
LRQLFTSDIKALLLAKREIDIDYFEQLIDFNNLIPFVEAKSSVNRIIVTVWKYYICLNILSNIFSIEGISKVRKEIRNDKSPRSL